MTAELRLRDLTVRFDGLLAVSGVSLHLRAGEVLGLIGPNGAGKSTLINCVTGFQRPTSGAVSLDGEDLARKSAAARTRAGIVRTFQTPQLFERLSVSDSVRVALERGSPGHASEVEDILARVGIAETGARLCGELPYGLQRLAELARALACRPRIMLLDEPAAGLAASETDGLVALVRRLARDLDIGVLLVEHNMSVVRDVSDRVVVMRHGEVLTEGAPDAVLSDPAVVEAYLGNRARPVGMAAAC